MNVLRRWVWPGLKFLVFAAIAVALVRLAFFAATPPEADTVPTGQITDPVVTVATGDISNDVEAKGTIRSVASTPVRATVAGAVNRVFVANGTHVEQGAAVIDVRVETPVEGVAEDGSALPPKVTFSTVTAAAAGTVSGLDLVEKQPVEIGTVVARVAPESYRASATLQAAQLYRLVDRPSEATVTVKDGPAPFTCTNLSLTSAPSGDGAADDDASQDGSASDASTGGTQLECDVPGDVTVFPGLEVTMAVPAGKAEGVLTLPTTAVQGTAQRGIVTVVGKSGDREQREVELGITDGEQVEVKTGLAEGDEVLQFVPGKEQTDDDAVDGGSVVSG